MLISVAGSEKLHIEFKLDADYDAVVGDNTDEFMLELRTELALQIGVPVTQIQDLQVAPGQSRFGHSSVTSTSFTAML